MNRFELDFSPVAFPDPVNFRHFAPELVLSVSEPAGERATVEEAELVTRRMVPGTSVRRLRNRRSPWPRRS